MEGGEKNWTLTECLYHRFSLYVYYHTISVSVEVPWRKCEFHYQLCEKLWPSQISQVRFLSPLQSSIQALIKCLRLEIPYADLMAGLHVALLMSKLPEE